MKKPFQLTSAALHILAMGSRLFYPIHQNVLWSFLISLGLIHLNEKARASGKGWKRAATTVATVLLGLLKMI